MRSLKVKTFICLIWIFSATAFFFVRETSPVSGQTSDAKFDKHPKPKKSLIEDFDKSIQTRFLTAPSFGISRIMPANPHLTNFYPVTDKEKKSVADFEKEGWEVSLYLYGKRTTLNAVDGKKPKDFSVEYPQNRPLPVTANLETKDLPKSEMLLEKVKAAFTEFQTANSPNENDYEFNVGKWTYVAKPVRAVQSCLECHTDYVMSGKVGVGKYKLRKRQVGDANGVLVYGFTKND